MSLALEQHTLYVVPGHVEEAVVLVVKGGVERGQVAFFKLFLLIIKTIRVRHCCQPESGLKCSIIVPLTGITLKINLLLRSKKKDDDSKDLFLTGVS